MPRWTKEEYDAYHARRRAGSGTRPVIQKQQDAGTRPIDNESKETEVDGTVCGQFGISITLLVSDKKDRDIDGAATTLLDCLVAAVGRLLQMDRLALRKLAKSEERRRGL